MIMALFGCAVTTGFGVIENSKTKNWRINCSIRCWRKYYSAAKLVSAYPIIAVDLYGERLKLATKFGAFLSSIKSARFSKGNSK